MTKKINLEKATDAAETNAQVTSPQFQLFEYTAKTGRKMMALIGDTKEYAPKLSRIKQACRGGFYYNSNLDGSQFGLEPTIKGWLIDKERDTFNIVLEEVQKFIDDPDGYDIEVPDDKQAKKEEKRRKREQNKLNAAIAKSEKEIARLQAKLNALKS